MRRFAALLVLAWAFGPGRAAHATGFEELGRADEDSDGAIVDVRGEFRVRGGALHNLDLDRGLTPSGRPFFPVPVDGRGQTLSRGDFRLRTGLGVRSPNGTLALKTEADLLAGAAQEGLPDDPRARHGMVPAEDTLRISRVWGEALLPVGVVAAGRMGGHFGLGLLANDGACGECDSADVSDRIAFVTPLAGHIWAVSYDIASRTALDGRAPVEGGIGFVEAVPSRTVSFAVLRWRDDLARARRAAAGKVSFEYGAFLSHRRHAATLDDGYVPERSRLLDADEVMARGFEATAVDGWVRLTFPAAHIEAEAALLTGRLEQASAIPGVLLPGAVHSRQWGGALETEFGRTTSRLHAGLDAGIASGDPDHGFGAFPDARLPARGDLEGPQGTDGRVDNFRFHPDYRVDRILFREILGTVTDAAYLRPHARALLLASGRQRLEARLAVVASRALHAASTPGGRAPLGIEVDPTLAWHSGDGLAVALEHAVLFPLAGLENPDRADLPARPAHALRLHLQWSLP